MSEGVDTSPKRSGFGSSFRNASNLRGGLLVTLLSVGLFVAGLYIKSATVEAIVLTMSGGLVAVGLAIMAGLLSIRAPQDFYGGLALVMLSALALLASGGARGAGGCGGGCRPHH
jgi:hypothetical protein